jgi:hypothetical protein
MTTIPTWTAEDQRDADELDAIYAYLAAVFTIWEHEHGRSVHQDRHGNRHGKAEDGTPLDTPHQYAPEFLAYLQEFGELECEDLAEGEPPHWHDYLMEEAA